MGGGGTGEVQKKIRARDFLMKKKSCTPINRKKYSCKGPKKIHTRNVITKKFLRLKNSPPPPITFLMVRPLSCDKRVHVNFRSTYFQQDANRWQIFSVRRVRERPERLCSLPPLKPPQLQTKRAGYCHPYWKGTILNKYVCYTSYTRVYDP